MRIIRKKTAWMLILACIFLLPSCHAKNKEKKAEQSQKIIVAKLETPVRRLYFTGTLDPIKTFAVVSPVAGNIASLDFIYGERVKAGQKLLVLESKPLSNDYRKAVQDFVLKKETYQTNQASFQGTTALYKAGLIAKDEFITERTTYENSALNYLQSEYALKKVLHTAGVDPKSVEALSLANPEKVNKVLETHFRNIVISATHDGVALFPEPKERDGSSSSGKLKVGDTIKEDQLLLSIGDLSGLSAGFDVSEVDVDRIHKGMDVLVTGNAFLGEQLKGYISAVSVQANLNSSEGGLSMFSVAVKIPAVDPKVMQKIRVGMTAKFEVDIKSPKAVMLPVNAVTQQNGQSVVTILDAKGKQKTVPVETGETTSMQVVIINGVKPGDKVVVP